MSSNILMIGISVFALFVLTISALRSSKKSKSTKGNKDERLTDTLPYEKSNSILTNRELTFYEKLKPVVDKYSYTILIKPRLADIIKVKKNTPQYYTWFNKISAKHIDFLLCTQSELSPIIGIELDDKSHEKEDRQERDAFVDEVFKTVSIPILHIKDFSIEELENRLSAFIKNADNLKEKLTCPNCQSALIERENKETKEKFYGCSSFPKCRYNRPIDKPSN